MEFIYYYRWQKKHTGRYDILEEAKQARYENAKEIFGTFINSCEK